MAAKTKSDREALTSLSDTLPLVASALAAWWTTVRAAVFNSASTWSARAAAVVALVGMVLAAYAIVRGSRHYVTVMLAGFVVPCAAAWMLGPDPGGNVPVGTALLEPVEIFLGAMAWTALGFVLMRPHAVIAPKGAEGGGGPTIGASDDVSRIAMREVEAEMSTEAMRVRLMPRHTLPRIGQLPIYVAALLAAIVAYQLVHVGTNTPERAVLARLAAAAVAIALMSTAGDLVEVRYVARAIAKPRSRARRAALSLALVAVLALVWFFVLGRDDTP